MKYIVYETTNLVNNKIYVGVHGTEDPNIFDGYIGNSINIFKCNPELNNPKTPFQKAVKKYGYENFRREILNIFDTAEEALELESIIVNEEFINREDTYNATVGGGFPPSHDKIIYQYSLNGDFIKEWKSLSIVAKEYNTSGNIIGVAANYKRTSIGYLWSFIKYDKLDVSKYNVYNNKIPVYVYNSNKIFIKCYDSISESARNFNTHLSKIQRAIALGNSIDGFYLSKTLSLVFISPNIPEINGKIHQYNIDGEYIRSFVNKEELKLAGFNLYNIKRSIRESRTYNEYIWICGEKLDKVPSKKSSIKHKRKVGQYTIDGKLVKIFDTLRSDKLEFPNVSKVLSGVAKHCHNYIFKYIQ